MKRAFTLAEVLVTLSIMGVVMAMIIPTLMADKVKEPIPQQINYKSQQKEPTYKEYIPTVEYDFTVAYE